MVDFQLACWVTRGYDGYIYIVIYNYILQRRIDPILREWGRNEDVAEATASLACWFTTGSKASRFNSGSETHVVVFSNPKMRQIFTGWWFQPI
jgi:hypothetical protein